MTARPKRVAALAAIIVLTACNDGLIYSEWTSINLASARVNADPATPVAIKLGFDRNVVAVAPPLGGTAEPTSTATVEGSQAPSSTAESAESTAATTNGCASRGASKGEAVSQFSTFSVNVNTPFAGPGAGTTAEPADRRHTWIHSRFASGAAALEISCHPRVVAAVLGFRPLTNLELGDIPLLERLSNCVNAMDQETLNELARTLDITLSEIEQRDEQEARQAITGRFLDLNSDQLKDYATKMQQSCPA